MINYITKIIRSLTQSNTPTTPTSLLFHLPCTRKLTSSQPDPPGPSSIKKDAHGIKKLLLKTQVSEDFA